MITAPQMTRRATRLGASELPAVLGFDEHRSAADVWLEKTGQAEPFKGNAATKRGQRLEPGLIMFAEEETGLTFERDTEFVHPSDLLMVHPDGTTADGRQGLEAKSTIICGDWDGEPLTDQIPDRVLTQTMGQFICSPILEVVWVPVAIIRFDIEFRLFKVERNDELAAMVERNGLEFMERYVLPRVRPDDFRPSLDVLKRVKREPGKVVPLNQSLFERLIVEQAARMQAEEHEEEAKAAVIAALGDAEAGELPDGRLVKYMLTKRKGYEVKETEFRQLRLPKAAKGMKS